MKTNDSKTEKRREREKTTISCMVAMHCAGHHAQVDRTETAYCGQPLCPECLELDNYAVHRTQRCRQMAHKTSCEQCPNQCYSPAMRARIREVMRWSGPRMIFTHPIYAIRHIFGK